MTHTIAGLRTKDSNLPVPLLAVGITTHLVDISANILITQKYVNREAIPLEVTYKSPIHPHAAIYSFESTIDGHTTRGVVREKEEARAMYDDALAQGHGASLMEQCDEEVFEISVGNLLPGKACEISIRYGG